MAHPEHLTAHDNPETAQMVRRATLASICIASVLVLAKLVAWWQSHSLAMLSSLTDSTFDLLSSALNFIAVRYALKPADDDHRFGHTSIEDIAGLAQCAFITASMLIIILQAFSRLTHPMAIEHEALGIGVSALAVTITLLLVAYQTYVARRSRSLVLAADRLHYVGDIAFNIAVLVAFAASMLFGWVWADPVMALIIAAAVLWSSRAIGIRAYHNLMDREMPDDEKAILFATLKSVPELRGYHNLKTRYSGAKPFIQFHAEIDASLSFRAAHAIIDRLESVIEVSFPGADVIIHPDPVEVAPPRAYDA